MAWPTPSPTLVACSPDTYYAGLRSTLAAAIRPIDGTELRSLLHDLIDGHTVVPYTSSSKVDTWDAVEVLDESSSNASEVMLVYSRKTSPKGRHSTSGWNREHVWPKSYGVGYTGADTSDLHSLRAADWNVNRWVGPEAVAIAPWPLLP